MYAIRRCHGLNPVLVNERHKCGELAKAAWKTSPNEKMYAVGRMQKRKGRV